MVRVGPQRNNKKMHREVLVAYIIAQPQRLTGEIMESHKTNQSVSSLPEQRSEKRTSPIRSMVTAYCNVTVGSSHPNYE
jgi:hypothetical protein